MVEPRSRYAAPEKVSRLPSGSRKKRPYTVVSAEGLVALRKHLPPAAILHLEMLRLSGLRWVKRRDGWVSLNQETLTAVDLADKHVRFRAVRQLRTWGWLEVRGTGVQGRRLEYRLNPDWAKPKALRRNKRITVAADWERWCSSIRHGMHRV
jgi:hypothetical protein